MDIMTLTNTSDDGTGMDMAVMNGVDWSMGRSYDSKLPLWILYNFFNLVGCGICVLVITGILLLPSSSIAAVAAGTGGRGNGNGASVTGRNSSDIFIIGLCVGCIIFSFPCAIQCFANLARGYFAYGHTACDVEAFFHVAGILQQFFSITAGGYRNYLAVVKNVMISERVAIMISISSCTLSFVGTVAVGRVSTIYLMPSGTYCLYRFNSPVIYGFFFPSCVLALLGLIIFYWHIFRAARLLLIPSAHGRRSVATAAMIAGAATATTPKTAANDDGTKYLLAAQVTSNSHGNTSHDVPVGAAVGVAMSPSLGTSSVGRGASPLPLIVAARTPVNGSPATAVIHIHHKSQRLHSSHGRSTSVNPNSAEATAMRVAQRSVSFVVIFFCGWIFAITCCIYEISTGYLPPWLDATAASLGCAHTVVAPLVYGWANRRIRVSLASRWSCFAACCLFGSERDQMIESSHHRVSRHGNGTGQQGNNGHGNNSLIKEFTPIRDDHHDPPSKSVSLSHHGGSPTGKHHAYEARTIPPRASSRNGHGHGNGNGNARASPLPHVMSSAGAGSTGAEAATAVIMARHSSIGSSLPGASSSFSNGYGQSLPPPSSHHPITDIPVAMMTSSTAQTVTPTGTASPIMVTSSTVTGDTAVAPLLPSLPDDDTMVPVRTTSQHAWVNHTTTTPLTTTVGSGNGNGTDVPVSPSSSTPTMSTSTQQQVHQPTTLASSSTAPHIVTPSTDATSTSYTSLPLVTDA